MVQSEQPVIYRFMAGGGSNMEETDGERLSGVTTVDPEERSI